MRSVMILAAALAERSALHQQRLGDLRDSWAAKNPGTKNNPHCKTAQTVAMKFSGLSNQERYAALSRLFNRPINTTYDLTLAEAAALLKVAATARDEFMQFIQAEEVSLDR